MPSFGRSKGTDGTTKRCVNRAWRGRRENFSLEVQLQVTNTGESAVDKKEEEQTKQRAFAEHEHSMLPSSGASLSLTASRPESDYSLTPLPLATHPSRVLLYTSRQNFSTEGSDASCL